VKAGVQAEPETGSHLLRIYGQVVDRRKEVLVDFWRIVVSILLPPLGVFWQVGLTKHFWINILLTLIGYVPGLVHAVWVIAKYK
jgi:uncharacterized membrane protein YqaE (UPF0057 family)